jgi:hypothetical protein
MPRTTNQPVRPATAAARVLQYQTVEYFDGFAAALDPSEADEIPARRPADPGLDRLQFDLIDDRRFGG